MAKMQSFGGLGAPPAAHTVQLPPPPAQMRAITAAAAVRESYGERSFAPELQNVLADQIHQQAQRDPDNVEFRQATSTEEMIAAQSRGEEFQSDTPSGIEFLGADPFTGLANYRNNNTGAIMSSTRFPSAAAASNGLATAMSGTVQMRPQAVKAGYSVGSTAESIAALNNSLTTEVEIGTQRNFDPDADAAPPPAAPALHRPQNPQAPRQATVAPVQVSPPAIPAPVPPAAPPTTPVAAVVRPVRELTVKVKPLASEAGMPRIYMATIELGMWEAMPYRTAYDSARLALVIAGYKFFAELPGSNSEIGASDTFTLHLLATDNV